MNSRQGPTAQVAGQRSGNELVFRLPSWQRPPAQPRGHSQPPRIANTGPVLRSPRLGTPPRCYSAWRTFARFPHRRHALPIDGASLKSRGIAYGLIACASSMRFRMPGQGGHFNRSTPGDAALRRAEAAAAARALRAPPSAAEADGAPTARAI